MILVQNPLLIEYESASRDLKLILTECDLASCNSLNMEPYSIDVCHVIFSLESIICRCFMTGWAMFQLLILL